MFIVEKIWHVFLRRPYKLHCAVDDGKGQAVVLLHGIASTGESWQHVISQLDTTKYRVVSLDLLGFGNSPRPKWLEYSVEDHARSVMNTLERLKVAEPYILVGHSMGSLVAAEIAHRYPKKVKHLILHQMPLYNRAFAAGRTGITLQAYQRAMQFIASHPSFTLRGARVLGDAAAKLSGFTLGEDTWHPFEMSMKNTILKQAKETKYALTMPTDVIYGTFDLLVLRKNARTFFEDTEHIRFYTIRDIHRVARKSGALIAELITQNAHEIRKLSQKHGTLLQRFTMKQTIDKEKAPKSYHTHKGMNRRTAAIAAALSAGVFMVAASVALQNTLTGWELQVFRAINVWQAPEWQVVLARIISDLVWAVAGLVALLVLLPKTRTKALGVAIPAVLVYAVGYIIEHIINRGRPDVLLQHEAIIRAVQDGPGFPSGHMMTATIVACILWGRVSPLIRVVFVLLLILEAWARVFLGVHAPLDIVGGIFIALAGWFGLRAMPLRLQTLLRVR